MAIKVPNGAKGEQHVGCYEFGSLYNLGPEPQSQAGSVDMEGCLC